MSRVWKHFIFTVALISIARPAVHAPGAQSTTPAEAKASLADGFKNPPKPARPSTYYLLLNGYVDRDRMDFELEQLYAKGIRGLCVFDMGARGAASALPPEGPIFLSEAWLDNFAHLLRKAGQLGLDVQLAVSSSWDMGASWVGPRDASKALLQTSIEVKGPAKFDAPLPLPELPAKAPKDDRGRPLFIMEVAVLAVPEGKRLSAHEFILKLPPLNGALINRVTLTNTESHDPKKYGPLHLFAKDFSVAVSQTGFAAADFKEVRRASLEAHAQPQPFEIAPTRAAYIRLQIHDGHNPKFDTVQLGEFEVHATDGRNVAGDYTIDRMREAAVLVRFSSEMGHSGRWTADNLHDGARSGATGAWSSNGPPPIVVADRGDIVNLTDRLDADGRLAWEVPPGSWSIVRLVCANTGERLKVPSPASDGLATDHFSGPATERYIRHVTDLLQARFGDLRQTALKQLYLPSYEVRGAVWTNDFPARFAAYRGYDPTPFLPALNGVVIESREVTDRFVYDFRKTLGDLLVDAYYRKASESAGRAGLGIEAEAGGPGPPVHQVPVDALKALGAIDEVRGEYWPWRMQSDSLWVVKETACAAHVYGRRRVHMEAFTGFRHWQDGPFDLKPSADRAFCEGMNHVVWHTSSHQPPAAGAPGCVYGAGTHLTPNLIWWPMAEPFVDYLSRCSFMLQQGRFVADVCYYYGDQGYNFVPPKHVDPALGYGYDYDVANAEVLLNRMSVRDGRIVLPDGMAYELLVLPEREDMDLPVLRKLEGLVQAGATIVGPKPIRSNGLHDYQNRDRQVRKIADALWGSCDGKTVYQNAYGKGQVLWGRPLREVLEQRGLGPDFSFTSRNEAAAIDYLHRRTPQADIYFVSNKTDRWETIDAHFRIANKAPESWSPATGEMRELSVYRRTASGIRCTLRLPPSDSTFVIFRQAADRPHLILSDASLAVSSVAESQVRLTAFTNGRHSIKTASGRTIAVNVSQLPPPIRLLGPWKVHFPAEAKTIEPATFPELRSWTDHPRAEIRDYSGIARYEKDVDIPAAYLGKGKKLYLDLGQLWAVGRVRLNGRSLGIVWKPPYRIEITDAAVAGINKLEIEIANTWANRLAGDARLPADQRTSQSNISGTGTKRVSWKDLPPRASGLFGPAELIPALEKSIALDRLHPE